MRTILDPKVLAALNVPSTSHKLVRLNAPWGEWVSMPARYDAATLTEEDAQQDGMVQVHRGDAVEDAESAAAATVTQ